MNVVTKLKTLFAILLLSTSFSLLQAQPGGPGDPGGDPGGGGDANVPFDGGLSLLIAASVGYAAKKGYDKRKKDKATDKTEQGEL